MTSPPSAADPEVPRVTSRFPFAAIALVALIAGACTGGTPPANAPSAAASAKPSVAPPSAAASVAPASVAPSLAPSVGAPSGSSVAPPSASGAPATTVIDWGVIWDAVPPSFPGFPGAKAAVTGGGPASATLDLPTDPGAASAWFQAALKGAGFAIVGANGPREDGSFDILATRGSADCQTEVSLAPLGATTTATIYLAAVCPFV
jgi:hypothetical protein